MICYLYIKRWRLWQTQLVKRLLLRGKDSGRPDDTDESIIRNRIQVYNNQTAVVADFYAQQGRFENVDGVGSVDEISTRLFAVIDQISL